MFRLLHPWIKRLDTGLELCKVLDIFAELGALALDLLVKFVELTANILESLDELLGI